MALRAGYYGLKKKLLEKVIGIPTIKSIGSGLELNSSTGELSATGVDVSIIGNPEGEATAGDLAKLQIGDDIFNVPDTTYSNATTTEAGLMSPEDKVKLNGLDKDTYFLRSEQAVLGAKNLLPIKIATLKSSNTVGTWTGNTYAINNITMECTVDGEYVNAIKLNGTSNADFDFYLTPNNASDDIVEQGHTYILSSDATLPEKIFLSLKVNTTAVSVDPTEKEKSFTASANVNSVCVIVRNGAIFDNLTLKPMISLDGGEFVPFAMTNRELTETVETSITSATSITSGNATLVSAAKVVNGKTICITVGFTASTDIAKGANVEITVPASIKIIVPTCCVNGTILLACFGNNPLIGTLRVRPMTEPIPNGTTIYATFMGILG